MNTSWNKQPVTQFDCQKQAVLFKFADLFVLGHESVNIETPPHKGSRKPILSLHNHTIPAQSIIYSVLQIAEQRYWPETRNRHRAEAFHSLAQLTGPSVKHAIFNCCLKTLLINSKCPGFKLGTKSSCKST